MTNAIDTLVAGLRGASDVNEAYAAVDQWNRDGKTRDLLDLAAAIERGCDVEGAARWPYEALADHVEEVLALTPGSDHIDALLALLAKERVRSVQRSRPSELRVRAFASRLGHGQTKEALLTAIARGADRADQQEILACWMHETVLRGTSLDREEGAIAFAARLAERGHPLGSMPLTLLGAETEAPTYMPMYGANAIHKAVARLESGPASARTIPPPGHEEAPRVTRVDDAAHEQRLLEAVVPWTTGSNGTAEAKIFRFEAPIGAAAPGKWLLRALPLECLKGSGSLRAEVVGPEAVWGALFAAASNGGAYSTGLGGAYGRRAAWASLAALVDAPGDAAPARVDASASACRFSMFGAPGDWFNDIAWDIGILAVRAGGGSAAVLAATDTD
ncbi:MAG: hypothetical protein KF819_17690 [Labilithrix sp.]|nr:hypothetical protein [Labilithrix sp.]